MAVQEIGPHLRDFLLAEATVVAQIGQRFYPNHGPQRGAIYPYVVYHKISKGRWRTLAGASGVAVPRVQLDCYGDTYAKASAARAAIADVIDAFTASQESSSGGVCLLKLEIADERDDYQEPVHADEIGEHVCSLDVIVTYRQ